MLFFAACWWLWPATTAYFSLLLPQVILPTLRDFSESRAAALAQRAMTVCSRGRLNTPPTLRLALTHKKAKGEVYGPTSSGSTPSSAAWSK